MTESSKPRHTSDMLMRVLRWFFCVASFLALGSMMGTVLDTILFQVSHDYIYAPGSMLNRSVVLSLFLGCLYAATCSTTQRIIPIKRLLLGVVVSSSYSLIAAIIVAGVNYGLSRNESDSNLQLAPQGRIAFCEGLVWGAIVGAVLGTLIVISYQHLWLKRQGMSDSSTSL